MIFYQNLPNVTRGYQIIPVVTKHHQNLPNCKNEQKYGKFATFNFFCTFSLPTVTSGENVKRKKNQKRKYIILGFWLLVLKGFGLGKRGMGEKGKVVRFVDKWASLVDNFLQASKKFGFGHFSQVVKMLCGSFMLPCASGELGKGVMVAAFCPDPKFCACVEF